MAKKISLGSYTFRVRNKGQENSENIEDYQWEELRNIGSSNSYFLDFLYEFFHTMSTEYMQDEVQETMLVIEEARINYENDVIYGVFNHGPWGSEATLTDHNSGEVSYEKSEEEATLRPFFFLIHVPRDTKRGILILQRHGRKGIKSHFGSALKKAFKAWQSGYLLRFWHQVPGKLIEMLNEGNMREVEIISYDVPSDLADFNSALKDQSSEWEESRGEVRTRVVAKRGERFRIPEIFRKVVAGEKTFHEVRQDLNLGDEDRIKIKIDHHGTKRVVDLRNPKDMSPYFDITDEITLVGGHPIPRELKNYILGGFLSGLVRDVRGKELQINDNLEGEVIEQE